MRQRYETPSVDKKFRTEPRDIEWLTFMHRHGGRLPTPYIQTYKGASFDVTRRRLRKLAQLGFLTRPWQQKETIDPLRNALIHELTKKGIQHLALGEPPAMHGSFKHQVMLSCVSASIELNTVGSPITYIPRPIERFTVGTAVIPDQMFILEQGGKQRLMFLECDRGTEATESALINRKSWTRSISQYREILRQQTMTSMLLIVTVSKAKQEGILKVIKDEYPNGCSNILVTYVPEFGREFKPPPVLDMLGRYWERASYPPFKFV